MAETKNVLTAVRKDIMKKEIEKKCPHCEHIFSIDFIICPNCGKKYNKKY
jgi:uncharacterized Zn-finger protein